ncbi:hypothetical protein [Butyrivibrio sp. AD3002]|uniref:hypothetical protein n=1 Tax=Butyrivibrio sp. AD3002 TaxID=1280670 RepID=UPI0003B6181C|nr:hypothetical protein [Butyrivibrio sp. AD3002]
MDLKDMKDLVVAYDAIEKVADAVEILCGEKPAGGALDDLNGIVSVIIRNSYYYDHKEDPDHTRTYKILDDTKLSAEERAKKLIGIN